MVVKHEDAEELLLSQLLNWPHVSISVFLLDVAFTRSNVHEFKRYLSSSEEAPSCTAKKGVDVRFVEKSERAVQVFSYEYLCDYMMEVLHCLKVCEYGFLGGYKTFAVSGTQLVLGTTSGIYRVSVGCEGGKCAWLHHSHKYKCVF